MTGGPDDGSELYRLGDEPCLICGETIPIDWDGLLVWHYKGKTLGQLSWCSGSRQRLHPDYLGA
jgi:hypothetical protein